MHGREDADQVSSYLFLPGVLLIRKMNLLAVISCLCRYTYLIAGSYRQEWYRIMMMRLLLFLPPSFKSALCPSLRLGRDFQMAVQPKRGERGSSVFIHSTSEWRIRAVGHMNSQGPQIDVIVVYICVQRRVLKPTIAFATRVSWWVLGRVHCQWCQGSNPITRWSSNQELVVTQ